MKNIFIVLFFFCMIDISCKKEATIQPTANFSVGEYGGFGITYTDTVFTIGTYDALILRNQSVNADSILWNFGNGKTSNDNSILLNYDSAGNYIVTLTVFNKDGEKSIKKMNFKVMERVVKNFAIHNLQLNRFSPSTGSLPVFSKADIWLEIKYSNNFNDSITKYGDILAPVIYKSPVFSNIDSSFHSTLIFTLPNKQTILYPIDNIDITLKQRGTIVNLYAKDNSGTYLLASSYWSGLQIGYGGGNPAYSANYGLQFSIPGSSNLITLDCLYQ